MLRIPCPYCGVRDEPEFIFGGPSHITRPAFEVALDVFEHSGLITRRREYDEVIAQLRARIIC